MFTGLEVAAFCGMAAFAVLGAGVLLFVLVAFRKPEFDGANGPPAAYKLGVTCLILTAVAVVGFFAIAIPLLT